MTFHSILFKTSEGSMIDETIEPPVHFVDLNLDQIVNAITAKKQEYNLKPFFYTPLQDADTIRYRQKIAQDFDNELLLLETIKSFAQKMSEMRRYLIMIEKLYTQNHKHGWFLEAVNTYCDAVSCLADDLSAINLKSRGLIAFREFLSDYAHSDDFVSLCAETRKLKMDLSSIQYCVHVKGNRVKVRKYESEIDYSKAVEQTFEKFKQGSVKDYSIRLTSGGMNHIEADILDLVTKLFPEIFNDLDLYCANHRDFINTTISTFDREIQFYVSYQEYISKLKPAGLMFCYPQVSKHDKEIYAFESFDLALASKFISKNTPIVCNDFYLQGNERIIVVTGPNQGGKTTFARAFGQFFYLTSLGCPVPGRDAKFFLFDKLFTHFEKEEDIKSLRGKLQDDLVRIYDILNHTTPDSIIIMNEIFTSTTLKDAILLSKRILEKIIQLDLICICVTFIDELSSLCEKTVSMVSTVEPDNPSIRTYKVVRKDADGLSYAISIAEKHRVTYSLLKERIKS